MLLFFKYSVFIYVCMHFVIKFHFVHRCEVDLSTVPLNERQVYNHSLNHGRGSLVFLLTVNPCRGVSISDVCAAPLDEPQEQQIQLENYVNDTKPFFVFFGLLLPNSLFYVIFSLFAISFYLHKQ